ncbi:succinate-semialdehyde dehydrogenase / glutarate-semialdehyde dehydrogenase [Kytococcus aerolatus]|uniref:Succinate-semialdehyde dehydrogenase / glutarate-semialdehyde dehydrogenase n=1 Tax=Kytococcus aerolatus TaxID=592308 RepID=A0A212U123_9MICO|nr:NAD-dependent succinate-semialdehyde dehydrogenase [Kytococcus aerolatus]SNC71836.1 succinate-semialdehyde dehydrogenase / glutarate-semialdehyde dehydrogenase [Kytococcus aerolatus]
MSTYRTQNPATGELVEEFAEHSAEEVEQVLATAHEAASTWPTVPLEERAALLARVADAYRERQQELAEAIALEMGKPVPQAIGEVKLAASIYRWYAEHGPDLVADRELGLARGAQRSLVRTLPLGALLGVMPWNYPYYQVARFAAPNILLGNTIVLKHAQICAASAELMEELFTAAGAPPGVYRNVRVDNDRAAEIIADDRIRGVSLTGSERAGAAVAEQAGKHLKKVVLELGGSDAMIVLDDADMVEVAETVGRARMSNCGQACNSPKRILVPDDRVEEFTRALTAAVEAQTVGDPLADGTDIGPLSSFEARDGLLEQVQDAIDHGATVHTGGRAGEGEGAFVEPTVLTGVTPEMRAWSEELFGPVAMVFGYGSVDEAVELANSSAYGLSGSVWTSDPERGQEVAGRLDVGMAYVNEHGTTMPALPFGGVKRSGFGRELAEFGVSEFANHQLVRVH